MASTEALAPFIVDPKDVDRLLARCILDEDGCILFLGCKQQHSKNPSLGGYGKFWYQGRAWYAHRWMYQAFHGVHLDPKLDVDHSCKKRNCINPFCLEAITHRENIIRIAKPWRRSIRPSKLSAPAASILARTPVEEEVA